MRPLYHGAAAPPRAAPRETPAATKLRASLPRKARRASSPRSSSQGFLMRKSLAIGVVTSLSLMSFAAPSPGAGEKPLTLDNLVITLGATTYRIPHIEIEGASLPAMELAALFLSGDGNVAARLARISARRIAVPSMSSESRKDSNIERAAYRKLLFETVVSGRAATMRGDGGEETIESAKGGVQRVSWGASVAKGVDLAELARLALSTRGEANEPLKPLIEEEIVESSRLEDASANLVLTTGRLKIEGVRGRALRTPAGKLIERFAKLDPAKSEDDPALRRDVLDALQSFEAAAIDADDVVAIGKGEPAGKPFTAKIAHAGLRKVAGAGAGEMFFDDFSLAASDGGHLSVKRFALNDVQLAPVLEGAAYPKLARIEVRGVAADIPDSKDQRTVANEIQRRERQRDVRQFSWHDADEILRPRRQFRRRSFGARRNPDDVAFPGARLSRTRALRRRRRRMAREDVRSGAGACRDRRQRHGRRASYGALRQCVERGVLTLAPHFARRHAHNIGQIDRSDARRRRPRRSCARA